MKILDVDSDNIEELGVFCKMSQRKNPGYQRKLRWLDGKVLSHYYQPKKRNVELLCEGS